MEGPEGMIAQKEVLEGKVEKSVRQVEGCDESGQPSSFRETGLTDY